MANAMPKTKLEEVWSLITHHGMKNLHDFKGNAHQRNALRRSLTQLSQNASDVDDLTSAYMGLGMLANYENRHTEALSFFKRSYDLASSNVVVISNYARALDIAGQPDLAAQKFLETFRLDPHNIGVFQSTLKISVDYLYPEILKDVTQIANGILPREATLAILQSQQQVEKYLNFLKNQKINLNVYRSIFQCVDTLIYSEVSTATMVKHNSFINIDCDCYSDMIRVSHLTPTQISDLNDALEDRILKWVGENKVNYPDGELKRMVSHLTFYFMPMDNVEVAHENAS